MILAACHNLMDLFLLSQGLHVMLLSMNDVSAVAVLCRALQHECFIYKLDGHNTVRLCVLMTCIVFGF